MLNLLFEANVPSVLIGIETPNMESLIETNKPQNYRLDILSAIRKIQSHGLRIEASLIVGFDHDDETIFQQQFDFIQEACLVPVSIWTLTAMPGTRLWVRLHAEGRVFAKSRSEKMATVLVHQHNIVPKRMSLEGLLSGYRELLLKVHGWGAFEERLEGLLDRIESAPPLMLRMRGMSRRQIVKFFLSNLVNSRGRRSLLRLIGDQEAGKVKKRLLKRFAGSSDRERYLRQLINDAVNEQFGKINYELPVLLKELDSELEDLAKAGIPEREGAVFSISGAFRRSYESIFAELHGYVSENLDDQSRIENALVDILYHFLARWGSAFEQAELKHGIRHYGVQLNEACDRTIAMENGDPGRAAVSTRAALFESSARENRRLDPNLRKLSADVIRCVESAFWRLDHGSSTTPSEVAGDSTI